MAINSLVIAVVLLSSAALLSAQCPCSNKGKCIAGACYCDIKFAGPKCATCAPGLDIKAKCAKPLDPCNNGPKPGVETCRKRPGFDCTVKVSSKGASAVCTCAKGFRLVGKKCVSICEIENPCLDQNSECVVDLDGPAGYKCTCDPGLSPSVWNSDGVVTNCSCPVGSGYYGPNCDKCTCNAALTASCSDGPSGNGACTCINVNVKTGSTCRVCKDNYDIDTGCATLLNPCIDTNGDPTGAGNACSATGQFCNYVEGPVPGAPTIPYCDCKEGFKFVNGGCTDINECVEDENLCSEETRNGVGCVNWPGSYNCTCLDGWTSSNGPDVLDPTGPDLSSATVENCTCQVGSGFWGPDCSICTCNPLLTVGCNDGVAGTGACTCMANATGANCQRCADNYDLDKGCTQFINPCLVPSLEPGCNETEHELCDYTYNPSPTSQNTPFCYCAPGYKNVSGVCTDVNECTEGLTGTENVDPCTWTFQLNSKKQPVAKATCTNLDGAFNCTCPGTSVATKLDAQYSYVTACA